MTPDAVLCRYIDVSAGRPVDVDQLAAVVSLDATLLARWCLLLQCDAKPEALTAALRALDGRRVVALAELQAWTLPTAPDGGRMGLDRWQSELRLACLAEALAELVGYADPGSARHRVLLANAGLSLPDDALLADLARYRGSPEDLLDDAHIVIRLHAVVERFGRDGERAASHTASDLLGLSDTLFGSALDAASTHCIELMGNAGLMDDLDTDWHARLWQSQQLLAVDRFFGAVGAATDTGALTDAHHVVNTLLLASGGELLMHQADALRPLRDDELGELSIAVESTSSAIAKAFRSGLPQELSLDGRLAIVDRQLLELLDCERAVVWPVEFDADLRGVLLAGSDDDSDAAFAERYARLLADWLPARSDVDGYGVDALEAYRAQESKRLSELVHEANNPLSVVRNYLHILEMRLGREPEALEHVQLISEEVQRAANIIAQARQLSEVEPTEPKADQSDPLEQIDVCDVVRRVAALQRHDAEERDVVVALDLPRGPVLAVSDAERLTQVVVNLLRNAVEALHGGGNVTLSALAGVYRSGAEGVEVGVRDNGPGLPSAVLEQLFAPKLSSKGGDHQGLGLHIVHRLVGELAGHIDVRTTERGTAFTIFLPALGTRDGERS